VLVLEDAMHPQCRAGTGAGAVRPAEALCGGQPVAEEGCERVQAKAALSSGRSCGSLPVCFNASLDGCARLGGTAGSHEADGAGAGRFGTPARGHGRCCRLFLAACTGRERERTPWRQARRPSGRATCFPTRGWSARGVPARSGAGMGMNGHSGEQKGALREQAGVLGNGGGLSASRRRRGRCRSS
jgi:hypothetical protein